MVKTNDEKVEIATYAVIMVVIGYMLFNNAEESMAARSTMVNLLANEISEATPNETEAIK